MNLKASLQIELSYINTIFRLYHYVKMCFFSIIDMNNREYPYHHFIQILIPNSETIH